MIFFFQDASYVASIVQLNHSSGMLQRDCNVGTNRTYATHLRVLRSFLVFHRMAWTCCMHKPYFCVRISPQFP